MCHSLGLFSAIQATMMNFMHFQQGFSFLTTYVPIQMNNRMNLQQKVKSLGFKSEEHKIITKDGYILTLHRILPQITLDEKKNPILFVHGIFADSNFWMINDRELSWPLILSNLGYDVWLANTRGTYYSNEHVNPLIKSKEYWNFSIDEMAMYDINDFVEFILHSTGRKQITYIGHSQGTLLLFAAVSNNAKLNEKVDKFIAIAPVAYLQHVKGILRMLTLVLFNERVLKFFFGDESCILLSSSSSNVLLWFLRRLPSSIFSFIIYSLLGYVPAEINERIIENIYRNISSPSSSKNILHFYQIRTSGSFSKFNYGHNQNLIKYKSMSPPKYDLKSFLIPSYVYSSENDYISTPKDVNILKNQLSNLKAHNNYKNLSHLDFVIGKEASKNVLYKIINNLKNDD